MRDTLRDTADLVIDDIGTAGDGIGRLANGQVVFVDAVLPGDKVRVRLHGPRKNAYRAELIEMLEPSAERVDSRCGIDRCGGCSLRGLNLDVQRRLKQRRIVEAMRRIGGIDVSLQLGPVEGSGDGWRYRHRVRLHAEWFDAPSGHGHGPFKAGFRLGYFERKSHRLVSLSSCPVLWPELEAAVLALQKGLLSLPRDVMVQEVEVAYSRRDGRVSVRLTSQASAAAFRNSWQWLPSNGLFGAEVVCADGHLRHGRVDLRYDHARAHDYDIYFEAGVFTQACPTTNDRLVDAVLSGVRPREAPRVVEFHAGIGNFSIPMARAGARVVTVEQSPRAVVLCAKNARASGLDIDIRKGPDEAFVHEVAACDVVVLDPPREGARAVAQALAENGPSRIIYISCDPATLARDSKELAAGGYTVASIQAFDMFPETPHVETVAMFHRPAM